MRISVIVPTLNEAQRLPLCLASLTPLRPVEVLVSDGGSTDETVSIARSGGARVVETSAGRARQMNAAAAVAAGDVLLFLHGDCQLPPDARAAIEAVLSEPEVGCGAFRHRIDSPRSALGWIAAADNFRAGWLHRPYGDQALFVRRELFAAAGGYPDVPILEDLLLVRQLRRRTRFRLAEAVVVTDARRWERRGILRTTLLNWIILCGAALGVPYGRLSDLYYGRSRQSSGRRLTAPDEAVSSQGSGN